MHTRETNIVGALVLQAADLIVAEVEAAGLAPREASALVLVATHPGCGIEWLRARLALTQSGTVRLVDRLVEQGRLIRAEGSSRRSVRLEVTTAGQEVLDRVMAGREGALARLLGPLGPDEQAVLAGLADRMLGALDRDRRAADQACRRCDWTSCTPACPVSESVG